MLERFWESRDKLEKRINGLESEIASLKTKLSDVNSKKEYWFSKKEELKKHLQESIKQIRELKIKKDNINIDIQKLKQERNAYNKAVGELISKVKQFNKEREEVIKKSNLRINPGSIRDKIEALERQIETEVISFSKEQKLMKQIKKMKGQYAEMTEIIGVVDNVRKLSNQIEETKTKAQGLHKKIQEYAKKDEEEYNEFIESSKQVGIIRQEQEEAFRRFIKLKRLFLIVNNTIRNKLEEHAKLKKRLEKIAGSDVKGKDEEIAALKEKLRYVEEKLRKGEKLTTEDILLFQKGAGNQ